MHFVMVTFYIVLDASKGIQEHKRPMAGSWLFKSNHSPKGTSQGHWKLGGKGRTCDLFVFFETDLCATLSFTLTAELLQSELLVLLSAFTTC